MTAARRRAFAIAAMLLIVVGVVALHLLARGPGRLPPRPPSARPTLLLLTSLPIVFGEDFSIQSPRSPVLEALDSRYRVRPISVSDAPELAKGRLLLMAHPLAQPAEDLVALDEWVRRGGRVLLLADPMLEWPSTHALGDPLRPPPMFMDTGLLGHWGLRLEMPAERGFKTVDLGGYEIVTQSPGRLAGTCAVSHEHLVAECRIGRGRAIIVADADFLDTQHLKGAEHNLDALLTVLARLEK